METKARKIRSDKKNHRVCVCCLVAFYSKDAYTNHFKVKGSKCFRPSEMKRILEDDEEPIDNEYRSFKKHWIEMMKEQWDDSEKNSYMFENVLTQRQWTSKKSFFDRLGDEINEEMRY